MCRWNVQKIRSEPSECRVLLRIGTFSLECVATKVLIATCKYHTSNDVFSRCKSVHKMATGKSDDELIQSDNKMRIGTRSGKS